jgi:hypothetical protein
MHNHERHTIKHPMHPLPNPGLPFHSWHLDFIQDLPTTSSGMTDVLVAVDRATRFTYARAYPNRDTGTVLEFVYELLSLFGCPSVLITDRANVFLSGEFQRFCEAQDIEHRASTAYHPQTNGLVERVNGLLENVLAKLCDGIPTKWSVYLNMAVLSINSRTHSAVGYSPYYLAFGVHPRVPSDSVKTPPRAFDFSNSQDVTDFTARELISLGQHRAAALYKSARTAREMARRHDAGKQVRSQPFVVGEFVKLVSKRLPAQIVPKFAPNYRGPYLIESVGPNDSYTLKHPNGTVLPHPVNSNHLVAYRGQPPGRGDTVTVVTTDSGA